jgi:hypothetical protein
VRLLTQGHLSPQFGPEVPEHRLKGVLPPVKGMAPELVLQETRGHHVSTRHESCLVCVQSKVGTHKVGTPDQLVVQSRHPDSEDRPEGPCSYC